MRELIVFEIKKLLSVFTRLWVFIFKRDPSIVLCTGWAGKRFSDNSRYIYLFLEQYKNKLGLKRIVWISNNQEHITYLRAHGYLAFKKNSWSSLYYHLRASYFIYDQYIDDFYSFLTSGAKVVNLWHGMPIKKFGLWNGFHPCWDLKDNYLMTCSVLGDNLIGKSFQVYPDHFIHGMYPRNFYLLHSIPLLMLSEMIYIKEIRKQKQAGKCILFYLPTFRKSTLCFLGEKEEYKITEFIQFLERKNYFLITKVHYAGFSRYNDKVVYTSQGLLNLPAEVDIYPFLKETDILLTDYSSVLFDFLYLNRDIIGLPYDLEDYKNNDQGLLFDYGDLPVDVAYNIDELKQLLSQEKTQQQKMIDQEKRSQWLMKCFGNYTIDDTIKNIFSK